MASWPLQTPFGTRSHRALARGGHWIENRLEVERERIGLWLPVALGTGIGAWLALPLESLWIGLLLLLAGGMLLGLLIGWNRRTGRTLAIGCATVMLGVALIWFRAVHVAAPVLAYPATTKFSAEIERVEALPAREQVRLILRPHNRPDLPPRLRVTLAAAYDEGLIAGEHIGLRARLMPPPGPGLPGGYDFAQRAWFDRLGAVGTVLGKPSRAPDAGQAAPPVRARLSAHVQAQIAGSAGGIASALVTGDRGAISDEDAEAMRRSGLAHLLSISGLHVTAVVGFTMLFLMRLLALSPTLALRGNVLLYAAAGAALAGIGYTWLTGAAVPTLRSCIAAMLVLVAFMLGREALTLRLVAAGAIIVMVWRPESLAGPSFQLSFAAVTAIIALHESPPMRAFLARRAESWGWRFGRGVIGLLVTGFVVEVTLAPIALFHFHKAGLYGALANVIAIPLTTFVIMPMEALALLFDSVGLGAPFWWVAEQALTGLIALAHGVSDAPGSVATLPVFPAYGFALTIFGGLWLLLWRSNWRWAGIAPLLAGALVLIAQPRPDLLVTSDGRHIAARTKAGDYALLRDRAGDYVRDSMGEAAGIDSPLGALAHLDGVECNEDYCRWQQGRGIAKDKGQGVGKGGETGDPSPTTGTQSAPSLTILASRSRAKIDGAAMADACAAADLVISDRWLPDECRARWRTIDRDSLALSGGLALYLAHAPDEMPRLVSALRARDDHPWRHPHQLSGNDEAVPTSALAP